jgi:tail collar domain
MKLSAALILTTVALCAFSLPAHADYSCTKAPCLSVAPNGWIIGEIRAFAFPAASQSLMTQELMAQGWVECAGQTLPRTGFVKLFNAIGDSWGSGDGKTDFYLPDLRGQTLRGWNHGGSQQQAAAFGGDPNAQARTAPRPEVPPPGTKGNTGDDVGSIQAGLVGQHTHTNSDYRYGQLHDAQQGNGIGMPMNIAGGGLGSGPVDGSPAENRVNNAYVMYAIYVGAPVALDMQTKKLTNKKIPTAHR